MKTLYLATRTTLLLVLTVLFTVCVNSQSFQWAKKAGGNYNDGGMAVAIGNDNNIYVAGFFSLTAGFDNDSITAIGERDVFIAKYNEAGVAQWVQQAGGGSDDVASGITTDADGNIIITGFFKGAAIFGDDTLISSGEKDIFIAKYTSAGICEWAISAGGTADDEGNSICTDASGNIYIAGYFCNNANFGSIQISGYGASDILIAKCDANGVWQWAQKAGCSAWDNGTGISIDETGSLFITGYYGNYYDQPAHFGTIDLPIEGGSDIFIAKCDNSGNFLWARKAGGAGGDMGSDITTDASGNCYATGYFVGTATFETQTLTSDGSDDYYIAKYDATGNLTWLRQVGGTGYFKSNGISLNGSDFVYLTGTFDNTAVFGDTTLTSTGYDNVFILKYDIDGNFYWAKQAKGSYYHIVQDVNNENADVYITGNLYQNAWFDCFFIYSEGSYNNYLTSDIFIAKLNDFINTSKSIGSSPFCVGENIIVPFTANYDFDPANVFTAQLSDLTGCFDNPVTLGTLTGTAGGTINGTIPENVVSGTTYRVRVVSSNPYIIGTDNTINLTINNTVAEAGADVTINSGESIIIGSALIAGYTYSWSPTTGLSDPSIANPVASPASSTIYHLTVTDQTTACSDWDSVRVDVHTMDGTSCENAVEIIPDTSNNKFELQFKNNSLDFWIKFTAQSNKGYFYINKTSLTPSATVTNLFIYSGNCYNLFEFANSTLNDSLSISIYSNSLDSGKTYYIKVVQSQGINGFFDLSINLFNNIKILVCPPTCNLVSNADFEIVNPDFYDIDYEYNDYPFAIGDVCGWGAAWGSPQISTFSSYLGLNHARMWAVYDSSPDRKECWGEGIYSNVDINNGEAYQITLHYYQEANSNPLYQFHVLFAKNTSFILDPLLYAGGSPFPQMTNVQDFFVQESAIPTTWGTFSQSFVANDDYDWIVIFPYQNIDHPWLPITFINVDDITLEHLGYAGPDITICPGVPTLLTATGGGTYQWCCGLGTNNQVTVTPTSTTTYTVTVTDINGCVSTSDVTVTMELTANAGIDQTICSGTSTHLSASICTGCTYAWSPTTDLSNPNIANPVATPSSQTTYIVTITDASGCTATDDVTVSLDCCLFQELQTTYSSNTTLTGIWAMNNDVEVMSGTLTLQICTVRVSTNYKLTVHPGATLKLNRCNLYTCINDMWQGIEVMAGGYIETSSTKIEDAITAIHMLNTTNTPAIYTINNTTFNKNYKGLVIDPYFYSYSSTIKASKFDCVPSLFTPNGSIGSFNTLKYPNPYAGKKSNTGIEINNVKDILGSTITIGSTVGAANIFQNIELGIHSTSSLTTVINSKFENIIYTVIQLFPPVVAPNSGICILAELGGKLIVGGTLPTQANTFYKSSNGIIAKSQIDLDAQGNTFKLITSPGFLFPSRCIYVESSSYNISTIKTNIFKNFSNFGVQINNFFNSDVDISNNKFKDFNSTLWGNAIYCIQNTWSTLNIKNNSFTNTGNTPGTSGIRVENISLNFNGATTIEADSIEYCKIGIRVVNYPATHVSGPLRIITNNIKLKYINPPQSADIGIQTQNCGASYIYDNRIYRQGNILPVSYDKLVIGVSTELNNNFATIQNNRTERLATGFRFLGSSAPYLNFDCNFMVYDRTGLDLADATTFIGDQGFPGTPGTASNNQWAIPASIGCWGVTSASSFTPTFYVKGLAPPWFPSLGQMNPFSSLSSFYLPNATYDCLYPCLTCIPQMLAKLVKGQSPFDSLTAASKHISFRSVYKQIREKPELYQTGMPEDSVLINFADSIALTNIGKFYTVQETYLSGDTLGAAMLNSLITPENVMEENQKTVNEIYFNTWAQGNYWFTTQDSATLFDIANQSPMDGGIAVYDARVMLQYYKDDGYSGATTKELQADTILYDTYGYLYPNPAIGHIYYSIELNEGEVAAFIIYDLLGNMEGKYDIKPEDNPIEINLSNFASGVYLYQLTINNEYKTSGKMCVNK